MNKLTNQPTKIASLDSPSGRSTCHTREPELDSQNLQESQRKNQTPESHIWTSKHVLWHTYPSTHTYTHAHHIIHHQPDPIIVL